MKFDESRLDPTPDEMPDWDDAKRAAVRSLLALRFSGFILWLILSESISFRVIAEFGQMSRACTVWALQHTEHVRLCTLRGGVIIGAFALQPSGHQVLIYMLSIDRP